MKLKHINETTKVDLSTLSEAGPLDQSYRKYAPPVNKAPTNPNYPTKPFDYDEWMKSSVGEESDPLHSREPAREPHPYRKFGTPLNKPTDPNNPNNRGPIDYDEWMKSSKKMEEETLDEVSTELLARYKTAAGADARKSDTEGDTARGNKRFSGIVKATNKQFDNDKKARDARNQAQKQTTEGSMGGINRCAPAVDVSYEKVLDDEIMNEVMSAYEDEQQAGPIGYHIIDRHTQQVVGKYGPTQRSRARARVDKLDNEYGGYRYTVKPIYADSNKPIDENKYRDNHASAAPSFTDVLNKQHQDKVAAEPPKKTVSIPFHGWEIKYRPASEPNQKVMWVVIKKDKILRKGESMTDKDAVRDAEEWITSSNKNGTVPTGNATIDFNSKFIAEFVPEGDTFYATFISQNGQPYFVMSDTPHPGLVKSAIRSGSKFPSVTVGPKVTGPAQLQAHGRYIIDTGNKVELDDGGVFIYPLVFQGIAQDKGDREHLKGPGLTVATSRGAEGI